MEAERARARWTWEEYARLPSEGSTRYEVIDGELFVTPAPSRAHQRVVGRLVARLVSFVEEHGAGEVYPGPFDVLFGEGDYLEPDLLFVRADRTDVLSDRGVEGPPDLVVEVISPSTAARDRGLKLERYRHFGVEEYWIVDPGERTIEVWRLTGVENRPNLLGEPDTLEWTPGPGGPTLTLAVGDLFGER